mgnify:FL=1
MAEIDRHDESRSLSPVVLGRFEQRRQRLTGPSGFDLDDILRGIGRRIDRNVARLLGHARHVGRHGRGRAGDRRIGREAPDQPAKAGIEVERPLRRVVVEFIPARRGEDARGGPVGNHHDDVAHRGDGFAVEGLRPGRQRGEEQKQQNCTFFHHNSLRFYGRCTGRRTTAKVSRIIGIGLPGKNGSKGTKKQENGKGYEEISKSGPEKSPGVREIRRTKKPPPRRTEGANRGAAQARRRPQDEAD